MDFILKKNSSKIKPKIFITLLLKREKLVRELFTVSYVLMK